ncbi:MAG: radical SAM protein [Candidatus Aminicenantes bacterium]|nr:radical SAM protein [Candidatus Aminicenantes bacterium]
MLKKETAPTAVQHLDLPEGVPPLTALYMYISGSCNLACRHCWIEPDYQTDNKTGKFIKLEQVKKAIVEAKPLGLQSVKLTGGEPMLHPHFREIVDLIDGENIAIVMETNGTLIDDELAVYLKSKKNFGFISVSIDGARAETHDKLRGIEGAFNKAISGIKSLVKAGFHPQLICTLHKGNSAEMEDVVNLADLSGCSSVKFNLIQHMGRGDDFAKKNGFEINEITELFLVLEDEIHPKYKIKVYFDIPIAFKPIRNLLKNDIGRCSVLNILSIISDGSISICGIGVTIPELLFGHITDDNLRDIWLTSPKLINLREEIPEKLEGICGLCIHRDTCLGSCVANNFHTSKKFSSAFYFCEQADKSGIFPSSRKHYLRQEGDKL